MAHAKSLRRRVLREAFEENYQTMHGIAAPSVHRRRRMRRLSRATVTVAAVAAIFGATYVLASRQFSWTPELADAKTVLLVPPPAQRPGRAAEPAVTDASGGPMAREVLPFSVRRVVIDPGHGGMHRGTASALGLQEKAVTLDIAQRLAALLEASGFDAILTRSTDDALSLEARGELANAVEADIFLSIHINWFSEPTVRAVETFYLGPTQDKELQRLAARENLDSEMALGEFRHALERVYAGVRRSESRELAQVVQRELLKSLKTINPWVEDRGVKSAPFGVLISTQMPAILAEIGCLSNSEEAQLLDRADYRQYLAEALLEGVRSYALNLNPNLNLGS